MDGDRVSPFATHVGDRDIRFLGVEDQLRIMDAVRQAEGWSPADTFERFTRYRDESARLRLLSEGSSCHTPQT